MKRSCGIVMPVFSLPSPYGIGTIGKAAYDFIDFLKSAGQSWWQMLPVGPTSFGDSPYQSFSAYAGNPYFIDLDMLIEDSLLDEAEVKAIDWGDDPEHVDYRKIYSSRLEILKKAKTRGWNRDRQHVRDFFNENAGWIYDYALFMALKQHFNMSSWMEWDEDIRLRTQSAVQKYTDLLSKDIELFIYIQYLFFKQWDALKKYAEKNDIGLIGDMPIYVSLDSADVWASPGVFRLDDDNLPAEVAGVPPDYFSSEGQKWGNPLYDWEKMKCDGYRWWMSRIEGASKLYDVIRIDHFRAFESYWAVPYREKTAKCGHWIKGPGMDFISAVKSRFPHTQFIAEDLGLLTHEVRQLVADSGLPGMKVLEFAFDAGTLSDYLPHNHTKNCVCYTGTHDNAPIMQWKDEENPSNIQFAKEYLGIDEREEFNWGILRGGLSSVADLFMAQMQDYLGLGIGSRINTPGIMGDNWTWRLIGNELTGRLSEKMSRAAHIYGRK